MAIPKTYRDMVVRDLLRADDDLIGNQAGLADAGAEATGFVIGGLGAQPQLETASGECFGVRNLGRRDRQDDQQ